MARRYSRLGEGKLGCIIWILALLAVIGIAAKLIPVKIRSAELYDFMEEQALFAGRRSPEQIQKAILNRAVELDLPLNKKGLDVKRAGGRIRIRAKYVVPVEFPGYTYMWEFEQMIDRPVFIV